MRPLLLAACLLFPVAMSAIAACGSDTPVAETKTVTVTVTASPTEQQVTWKNLQTKYGEYLSHLCDAPPLAASEFNACVIQQSDGMDAFKSDADGLPRGDSRAALVSSMEEFKRTYLNYFADNCEVPDKVLACSGPYQSMTLAFSELGRIVNREAAK